jgi:hypothetical protein
VLLRGLSQSSMDSGSGSNRKGKRKAIGYGRGKID